MVSAALPDFGSAALRRRVDARLVKGQAQLRRQLAAEFQIAVGLGAAQAVVQVGGVEHQAQFPASRPPRMRSSATESAPPESANGQPHAGLEQRGVESRRWRRFAGLTRG